MSYCGVATSPGCWRRPGPSEAPWPGLVRKHATPVTTRQLSKVADVFVVVEFQRHVVSGVRHGRAGHG